MVQTKVYRRKCCKYCEKSVGLAGLIRHENECYMNPKNKQVCPVCSKPVKNYKRAKTCSRSCANSYFRSGSNNPNWKESAYRSTCFHSHKKECIVCGEDKIVEVHHYDENKGNNLPENLIPLCPTHHRYWHSRYRYLIEELVKAYRAQFKRGIVSG